MSRSQKYKECLSKFIKDKNDLTSPLINDKIKQDDLIFSIVLLTTMNSQNKKNKYSTQGYYAASTLVFIKILTDLIEDNQKIPQQEFIKLIAQLEHNILKLIQQNINCLKNVITNNDSTGTIVSNATEVFLNYKTASLNMYGLTYDYEQIKSNDIVKWYIKDNEQQLKNFNSIKVCTKDSLNKMITQKINVISEYAFSLGWVLGGGDYNDINTIKKISLTFSFIYKLSTDYENFENDLTNKYQKNYVIIHGLQNSYNDFLHYKQKFIEEAMNINIFTNTLEEIIKEIEIKIDNVLDKTSPDIKSMCSSKTK